MAVFAFVGNVAFAAANQAEVKDNSEPSEGENLVLTSVHNLYLTVQASLAEQELLTIQEVSLVQISSPEPPSSFEPEKTFSSGGPLVIVTAYSSTPDQTDASPFITANGTYVQDGVLACNFLPFGIKVRFPDFSGDKIFSVEDRMAKKNSHKMDVWMPSRYEALQFGVKYLRYEIVE